MLNNQDICELYEVYAVRKTWLRIKTEYTPNESQLHEDIKSQPETNLDSHEVGITSDNYTKLNFSVSFQCRHTITKFH